MGNSWTVVVWKLSKRPKTGVSPTRGYDSDCGRLSCQKIDLAICFLAYHDSERLICSFFPRCLCMKNPAHRLLRIWPEIAGYMVASCSLSFFIVLMVATAMMLSTSIAHFHVAKPFQNVTWDLPKSGHYAHQCVNCWTSKPSNLESWLGSCGCEDACTDWNHYCKAHVSNLSSVRCCWNGEPYDIAYLGGMNIRESKLFGHPGTSVNCPLPSVWAYNTPWML